MSMLRWVANTISGVKKMAAVEGQLLSIGKLKEAQEEALLADGKLEASPSYVLPVSHYEEQAHSLIARAERDEAKLEKLLAVRLASEIDARYQEAGGATKAAKAVQEWPMNEKKGTLTKDHFKQGVRSLVSATNAQLTEIFERFRKSEKPTERDKDHINEMDVLRLTAAIERLIASTVGERANLMSMRAQCVQMRGKAERANAVGLAVAAFNEAFETAEAMRVGVTVDVRLGTLLIKHGIKVGDIVEQWDSSGEGEIDMDEFRDHVLAMGLQGEAEEIDNLFRSLDSDGGGFLDKAELRDALKAWIAPPPPAYQKPPDGALLV